MKKFTKLALTGALALGGLGVTSVADLPNVSPTAVEAATQTTVTDWNGYQEKQLALDVNVDLADFDRAYQYGDIYAHTQNELYSQDFHHIKIYLVKADNTLQRYKTIYPVTHSDNGSGYMADYQTTFTTAYPAGNYYAVHTFSDNGVNQAERSYRFTIGN